MHEVSLSGGVPCIYKRRAAITPPCSCVWNMNLFIAKALILPCSALAGSAIHYTVPGRVQSIEYCAPQSGAGPAGFGGLSSSHLCLCSVTLSSAMPSASCYASACMRGGTDAQNIPSAPPRRAPSRSLSASSQSVRAFIARSWPCYCASLLRHCAPPNYEIVTWGLSSEGGLCSAMVLIAYALKR